MALIAHESSLGRQIDASKRRAELRCTEHDPENIHWQTCDALVEQKSKLNLSAANFAKNAKPASIEGKKNKEEKVLQLMQFSCLVLRTKIVSLDCIL